MKLLLLNVFLLLSYAIIHAQSVKCTGDTCIAIMADYAPVKRAIKSVRNSKVKNVLTPAGKKTFGFASEKGNMIVPFMYDAAQPFKNGYAVVELDELRGIIDSTGVVVIPIKYRTLSGVSEGAAFYANSGKLDGIVTVTGKEYPLDPQLGEIMNQSFSTVNLSVDTCRMVYDWNYYIHDAHFSEGVSVVHDLRYLSKVVDIQGKYIFTSNYDLYDCKDGMFRMRKRISPEVYKYGFSDKTGKVIVQPIYHSATDFKNGRATVTSGNPRVPVTKVIDKTGTVLVK